VLLRATLLASCVLAATAVPALADTTVDFIANEPPAAPVIVVTGDDDNANAVDDNIDIAQVGSNYTITRRNGAILTDTPDECTENGPQVTCRGPVPSFSVDLGDGNDTLTTNNVTTPLMIAGGLGNDTLSGGDGNDVLDGGDDNDALNGGAGVDDYFGERGDDTIEAFDGNPERIACGADNDQAHNDFTDILAECERGIDGDHDGFSSAVECNDANPAIHPGAVDIPENGVDEDCSGSDALILDRDRDRFPIPLDCNDNAARIHPGAVEIRGNRVDENCDGTADGFALLRSLVTTGWQFGAHYTAVRALVVRNAPARARIATRCKGGGCPFKGTKKVTVKRALKPTSLLRFFHHAKLRAGARVTVRITAAGFVGRTYAYRIRIGDLPALSTTCRDPGSRKSRAC
jgi:putative metal-binding protein/hemolysin type calcium-binding protein